MKPHRKILQWIIVLLLFPALLFNLGHTAFINDEAIRALVALEMDYSGNIWVPTFFGEFYYNKPPLFNWLVLLFYKIGGEANEFLTRLPTLFGLLTFSGLVYYFNHRYGVKKQAFLQALLIITCGRILFYDSFLGLIDITFSAVMYALFMTIYHFGQKRRYLSLFIGAYLLAAIGFMLKALPAIAFLGITLLVYFIFYKKKWKQLFSWQHILGFCLFGITLGSYYFKYHQYNDLLVVFNTLFVESAKRTPVEYSLWDTLLSFVAFPFDMIKHFLPWSLWIVFLFRKDFWKELKQQSFIYYSFIVFIANILLYWISVEVYPRYIFMLIPLLFSTAFYFYNNAIKAAEELPHFLIKIGKSIPLIISFLTPVVLAIGPFLSDLFKNESFFLLKYIIPFLVSICLLVYYLKIKKHSLLFSIAMLLLIRISFNFFVIPSREYTDQKAITRAAAIEIGKKYKDRPLYIYKGSLGISPITGFHLTKERKQQLTFRDTLSEAGSLMIWQDDMYEIDFEKIEEIDSMDVQYRSEVVKIVEVK